MACMARSFSRTLLVASKNSRRERTDGSRCAGRLTWTSSTILPGLRDITKDNNGAFHAGRGWDACTGWGTPNGEALLAVLQEHAHA